MIEDSGLVLVLVEVAVVNAASAVDFGEALEFGGGEIF